MVPTNGSFLLLPDDIVEKIEEQIKTFQANGIRIIYSFSDDGKILDEINRPLYSEEKQDKEKFYKKLVYFANTYHYGFHPMVNAHGITKWVENFKWWKEFAKELNDPFILSNAMFLEVRNDEWTDFAIEKYLELLKLMIETFSQYYNKKLPNAQ